MRRAPSASTASLAVLLALACAQPGGVPGGEAGAAAVAERAEVMQPLPADLAAAPDPAELAESHFARLYGFDAVEAYESRHGPARLTFGVARAWRDGRAKLLLDVFTPDAFSKWALLLLHNDRRSDDLFVYFPDFPFRLVRRVSAIQLQKQVLFDVLPLGELRPIASGELAYTLLGRVSLAGEPCWLVEGRPLHRGLDFDRVELAISERSGFALRTTYFVRDREIRSVHVAPGDLRPFQERLLPERRSIRTPGSDEPTVLSLRNIMLDPDLPDTLFTHHNLRVQRFPGL